VTPEPGRVRDDTDTYAADFPAARTCNQVAALFFLFLFLTHRLKRFVHDERERSGLSRLAFPPSPLWDRERLRGFRLALLMRGHIRELQTSNRIDDCGECIPGFVPTSELWTATAFCGERRPDRKAFN